MLTRRSVKQYLMTPAIIRTPGLLMRVKPIQAIHSLPWSHPEDVSDLVAYEGLLRTPVHINTPLSCQGHYVYGADWGFRGETPYYAMVRRSSSSTPIRS